MPITRESMRSALAPPTERAIRIGAAHLAHPILHPIRFDLADGLSPDEAAVLAVLVHPTLRALRDREKLARAQLLQAGLLPNPELSASLEPVVGGDTAGRVTAFGLGLGWDLAPLFSRPAKLDAARAHARSINLGVAWQEWRTAENARLQLYRLTLGRRRAAVAKKRASTLQRVFDQLQRGVDHQVSTIADLAEAATALRQGRVDLEEADAAVQEGGLALHRALGLPNIFRVRPAGDIRPPLLEAIPSVPELVSDLEQRRLDLQALRLGYASQEADVRAAIRAQFPRIEVRFTGARDTDGVATIGPEITLALPFLDRHKARIARARATRKQLFDEYAARLFAARSEIARLVQQAGALSHRIARTDDAIQALSRLAEQYRAAADRGVAGILDSERARARGQGKILEKLALQEKFTEIEIALEIASGRVLVPDAGRDGKAGA